MAETEERSEYTFSMFRTGYIVTKWRLGEKLWSEAHAFDKVLGISFNYKTKEITVTMINEATIHYENMLDAEKIYNSLSVHMMNYYRRDK